MPCFEEKRWRPRFQLVCFQQTNDINYNVRVSLSYGDIFIFSIFLFFSFCCRCCYYTVAAADVITTFLFSFFFFVCHFLLVGLPCLYFYKNIRCLRNWSYSIFPNSQSASHTPNEKKKKERKNKTKYVSNAHTENSRGTKTNLAHKWFVRSVTFDNVIHIFFIFFVFLLCFRFSYLSFYFYFFKTTTTTTTNISRMNSSNKARVFMS